MEHFVSAPVVSCMFAERESRVIHHLAWWTAALPRDIGDRSAKLNEI